ncbi:MAG: protein kinase [Myxococcota bacterium]
MTTSQPSAADFTLPGYTVMDRLAQGGMATLYLARATGPDGKLVVIKRLRSDLSADRMFVDMFLQEQRLVQLLKHPNIVRVLEVSQTPGAEALVMEFLDGRNLLQVARTCHKRQGHVPYPILAHVLCETLEGLHHAHTLVGGNGKPSPLVHRDVSPDNILITFQGSVKLLDFGIAKAVNARSATRTGVIKGKLGYVAPETVLGLGVDARADLFSVGVSLYEMLTGVEPFGAEQDVEVVRAVCSRTPPAPHEVHSAVPVALSHVCMRALAKDRRQRFQTAREMQEALRGAVGRDVALMSRGHLAAFVEVLFPPEVRRRLAGARVAPPPTSEPAIMDEDKAPPTELMEVPVFATSRIPAPSPAPTGLEVQATTEEIAPFSAATPNTEPDTVTGARPALLREGPEPTEPELTTPFALPPNDPLLSSSPASNAVLPKSAPEDHSEDPTRRGSPVVTSEESLPLVSDRWLLPVVASAPRVLSDRWIMPLPEVDPDLTREEESVTVPSEARDALMAEMNRLLGTGKDAAVPAQAAPQALSPFRAISAPAPLQPAGAPALDEDNIHGMATCPELSVLPVLVPARPAPIPTRLPAEGVRATPRPQTPPAPRPTPRAPEPVEKRAPLWAPPQGPSRKRDPGAAAVALRPQGVRRRSRSALFVVVMTVLVAGGAAVWMARSHVSAARTGSR